MSEVFDWAEHAPDLAEPTPRVSSGAVVLRPTPLPARVEPGLVLAYDERTGEPYYRRPEPVALEQRRDVWPARLLCGGVGVGAAGLGLGFMFEAIAQATLGIGLTAACLALVWLLKSGGGRGGGHRVQVRGNGNKVSVR